MNEKSQVDNVKAIQSTLNARASSVDNESQSYVTNTKEMAHTQQTFNINQGKKLLGGKNDYKSQQLTEQGKVSKAGK